MLSVSLRFALLKTFFLFFFPFLLHLFSNVAYHLQPLRGMCDGFEFCNLQILSINRICFCGYIIVFLFCDFVFESFFNTFLQASLFQRYKKIYIFQLRTFSNWFGNCYLQVQALVGFEKTLKHLDEHLVNIGTKVSIIFFLASLLCAFTLSFNS